MTAKLCRYLGLDKTVIQQLRTFGSPLGLKSRYALSFATLCALTGAPLWYVRAAVLTPGALEPGKCYCRFCPEKSLTKAEEEYLTDEATLSSWRTFSLL